MIVSATGLLITGTAEAFAVGFETFTEGLGVEEVLILGAKRSFWITRSRNMFASCSSAKENPTMPD